MYADKFKNACALTRELGLALSVVPALSTDRCFSQNKLFVDKINLLFSRSFVHDFMAKCNFISVALQTMLDAQNMCQSYLTVGTVIKKWHQTPQFKINAATIKQVIGKSEKTKSTELSHHCWLTLESGEIIDLAYLISERNCLVSEQSLARYFNPGELIYRFGRPDDMEDEYVPILVGDDFYKKHVDFHDTIKSIFPLPYKMEEQYKIASRCFIGAAIPQELDYLLKPKQPLHERC